MIHSTSCGVGVGDRGDNSESAFCDDPGWIVIPAISKILNQMILVIRFKANREYKGEQSTKGDRQLSTPGFLAVLNGSTTNLETLFLGHTQTYAKVSFSSSYAVKSECISPIIADRTDMIGRETH